MTSAPHLLLLAGSGEARQIASDLAARTAIGALKVTASLLLDGHWSGRLSVPTRHGGFGGDAGFAAFLQQEGVTAVLDATHPFAARISARSWSVCQDLRLPFLQLDRPGWTPGPGDSWTEVASTEDAVPLIPKKARVFVTTGRASLPPLLALDGRQFFVRRLTDQQEESNVRSVSYVYGNGPFSVSDEVAIFSRLGIDLLLCKNSGGAASRTKLEAARQLGLPVLLLARPPVTGAPLARTVPEALDWVARTCR